MLDVEPDDWRPADARIRSMSHWDTQKTLIREHHADLDREALREHRSAEARAARPTATPSSLATGGHLRRWARAGVARLASAAARWAPSIR
jgi:hypothetical protein